MATVALRHVWKLYGDVVGVKDVEFTCADGEFFALLGPSGCGKSSTLRMIAGLEQISKGEIYFDERLVNDLDPRDRNVAMVFETYALYPFLSVYDNIAFPLHVQGLSKKAIDEKVRWASGFLGIDDILRMRVGGLSSGQKQAVGIGRAIVRSPSVLLMDEPISHLEAQQRAKMREELVGLHAKLKTTTVYVTHDQAEAIAMADRIGVMNLGELQQVGTPEDIYGRPRTEFVAGFIGEPPMNFHDCELETEDGRTYAVSAAFKIPLPSSAASFLRRGTGPRRVRLGVRPENVEVSRSATENATAASVRFIEPQGERTIIGAKLSDGTVFLVVVADGLEATLDERIFLRFGEPIYVFDASSGVNLLYGEGSQ